MNSAALTIPRSLTGTANSFGMLTSSGAVPQSAVPAANAGTLPARPAAGPKAR